MGGWWTTAHGEEEDLAICHLLYDYSDHVQKFFYPKNYDLSVRCVWD
jgi:hypothetical protein